MECFSSAFNKWMHGYMVYDSDLLINQTCKSVGELG